MKWETKRPYNGQLCHEYVYQKLLKLDNPSYGKKNFGAFLCRTVYYFKMHLNAFDVVVESSCRGGVVLALPKYVVGWVPAQRWDG